MNFHFIHILNLKVIKSFIKLPNTFFQFLISLIKKKERLSLISINYHILFSLLQSVKLLMKKEEETNWKERIESVLLDSIYESFRLICSSSNETSKWYQYVDHDFKLNSLVKIQQSALMSTLNLKSILFSNKFEGFLKIIYKTQRNIILFFFIKLIPDVDNCTKMKLISIYFQYCSIKVFEPMNVYEKCKVFMCSMRCSDNRDELLCMIKSLNEILLNKDTRKEIRIILLKEHISYLLKLTSITNTTSISSSLSNENLTTFSSNQQSETNSSFLPNDENNLQLASSLIDLFESMVFLMSDQSNGKFFFKNI